MIIDTTDVRALEVLADQLQEQGDPRGEFIALQCRRAKRTIGIVGRRRLNELRRELLGELCGLVTKARFKCGLLQAGVLQFNRKRLEACWDDAHWSTLESLDLRNESGRWFRERQAEFINSRPMLHTLLGLGGVPDEPCPRVTTVSVSSFRAEPDELARAFPSLKRLALSGPIEDAATLWAHPLIRRLDVLMITSWFHRVKLLWTKETLCLEETGYPGEEEPELIMAGPALTRLELPFDDAQDFESYLEQSESRFGKLVEAATMRGAQLIFSGRRGWERPEYPSRFLEAV